MRRIRPLDRRSTLMAQRGSSTLTPVEILIADGRIEDVTPPGSPQTVLRTIHAPRSARRDHPDAHGRSVYGGGLGRTRTESMGGGSTITSKRTKRPKSHRRHEDRARRRARRAQRQHMRAGR